MPKFSLKEAKKRLITFGLTFPETTLEHPWGQDALKVKGKIFADFGGRDGELSMAVKLPVSSEMALTLAWVEPSGYGLAKSGWVTARLKPGANVDIGTMQGWMAQSYRAVAPKKLSKLLAD